MARPHDVAGRFGAAAPDYESHALAQRHAAAALAQRIAARPLPARPRILEIGCGTGLFTRALAARIGPADWTLTDIAPAMLAQARRAPPPGTVRYAQLDGERPDALRDARGYDLVCSSLAVQWFEDLDAGLARLSRLLAPGGWLAIATLAQDTFLEWRAAHQALGLRAATPAYPRAEHIGTALRHLRGGVQRALHRQHHPDALAFVRGLKGIGACLPAAGRAPLSAAQMRAVLARFNQQGNHVSYDLAYGLWQNRPAGVFVTGTDTGVGKTLVSAVLTRAWEASYWKPLQTGLADEPGDTATVRALACLDDSRVLAPAYALQAPLAPWAAAPLEGVTIDMARLTLPQTGRALVVEGAGGLLVPIDDTSTMLDLIARLGLPVVLAARSGLGTINHTLLSLAALRARGIPVAGVVMSGPRNASNREAIERFGKVRVLAEIDQLDPVTPEAVAQAAQTIPPLAECLDAAV
ncbi:dethiobiotin synthase [Bordetella genomosp. 1]|uniref:ATP-dependent dethiobiotin synthetase BioD n=1 Tax=Bordetella genomosp. 1 TaxID=1395607 RepID=A0ABX4EUY1_9BORD|nr:dethiobiotin synthase [Bordetella genomosp. 1]OZI58047.1 dethiobiotin synthase [Bordetella genomosp. 1]